MTDMSHEESIVGHKDIQFSSNAKKEDPRAPQKDLKLSQLMNKSDDSSEQTVYHQILCRLGSV